MFGFLKKTFKKQPSAHDAAATSTVGEGQQDDDQGKGRIRNQVLKSVKITQRDKRDKLIGSKRDFLPKQGDVSVNSGDYHFGAGHDLHLAATATTSSSSNVNSTYLVNSNAQKVGAAATTTAAANNKVLSKSESNRRRLLEEWRLKKKKEEQTKVVSNQSKPVFKVHHVNGNLFSKSSQMPTSASFNFHVSYR